MLHDVYLAGFFDGEGCIVVGTNGSLQLRVINTSFPTLELFQRELRGSIKSRKQRVNKPQYVWSVYGDDAVWVLNVLLSFLIEKHEQAVTALAWMVERDYYKATQLLGRRGQQSHPERQNRIDYYRTALTQQKLGTYIGK